MRTLFVWAGGLALYYSSGTGKIGERWDNYSYFQVPPPLHLFLNVRNLSVLQQHRHNRGERWDSYSYFQLPPSSSLAYSGSPPLHVHASNSRCAQRKSQSFNSACLLLPALWLLALYSLLRPCCHPTSMQGDRRHESHKGTLWQPEVHNVPW